MSTNLTPASALLMPPRGLDEIISTFGDIFAYIGPITLSVPVGRMTFSIGWRCHSRFRSLGTFPAQ